MRMSMDMNTIRVERSKIVKFIFGVLSKFKKKKTQFSRISINIGELTFKGLFG